jgi:adenosylcobinamide kinase/adenosylcobinamide-phosphate guanylyltransferase
MMLLVVTGPVRSGKSRMALSLALQSERPVYLAVGGREDDPEMTRRIARHKRERADDVTVVEADAGTAWIGAVPPDACLLVDCLGTVIGRVVADAGEWSGDVAEADAEEAVSRSVDTLVRALVEREGPTIIVTNEVGWGIVPASPMARVFRDELGRAGRELVKAADGAWLVVAGRCVSLSALDDEIRWEWT